MELLAWKYVHRTVDGALITWLVATDYGVGRFVVRWGNHDSNPTFVSADLETHDKGFLAGGLNKMRRHPWWMRLYKAQVNRTTDEFGMSEVSTFAHFEWLTKLTHIFNTNEKACNVWSNLRGEVVGIQYAAMMEKIDLDRRGIRQAQLVAYNSAMAAHDEQWGIF